MSIEELEDLVKPLLRTATKFEPHADVTASAASIHSKFGGAPYAEAGHGWPVCTGCGDELTFIVQLEEASTCSLHVLFYCFECFPWGTTRDERGQWEIRSYNAPTLDRCIAIERGSTSEMDVTPCVVSESEVHVLPSWDGIHTASAAASDQSSALNPEEPWEPYTSVVKRLGCLDDYATILGGYARFVQGEADPACLICGEAMMFFAQIDSEDQADLMWGDVGLIYLFRCAQHPSEFHLELQCH